MKHEPFTATDWLSGAVSAVVIFFLSLAILAGIDGLPLPVTFLLPVVIGLANAWSAMRLRRKKRERRQILEGHCRECGYNLTGNTSGVCPECGTKI